MQRKFQAIARSICTFQEMGFPVEVRPMTLLGQQMLRWVQLLTMGVLACRLPDHSLRSHALPVGPGAQHSQAEPPGRDAGDPAHLHVPLHPRQGVASPPLSGQNPAAKQGPTSRLLVISLWLLLWIAYLACMDVTCSSIQPEGLQYGDVVYCVHKFDWAFDCAE